MVLIEATAGCSRKSCAFCGACRDICFHAEPMEQIRGDILEAAAYDPNPRRVFLLSGDAFVPGYSRLAQIAAWIQEAMPSVETITMFSTIPDIAGKTDAELRKLQKAKIHFLYPGTESGDQEVLDFVNKGYTVEEALKQCRRLEAAGIRYFTSFITGICGDDDKKGFAMRGRQRNF